MKMNIDKRVEKFIDLVNFKVKRSDDLSIHKLAKNLDIKYPTLQGYLSRKTPMPLHVAVKLALYFNVDLNDVFEIQNTKETTIDNVSYKLSFLLKDVDEANKELVFKITKAILDVIEKDLEK